MLFLAQQNLSHYSLIPKENQLYKNIKFSIDSWCLKKNFFFHFINIVCFCFGRTYSMWHNVLEIILSQGDDVSGKISSNDTGRVWYDSEGKTFNEKKIMCAKTWVISIIVELPHQHYAQGAK